jgi:DNA-binding IclR family transcriptional regulator
MDNATVNRILNELQLAGFVEVYRSAQPYQLLLLSHDKSLALRKLYGAD